MSTVASLNAQYDFAVMSFQEQYTLEQVEQLDVVFPHKLGDSQEYWGLPKILVRALNTNGAFALESRNGTWTRVTIWFHVTKCVETGYEQVLVELDGFLCLLLPEMVEQDEDACMCDF